MDKEQRIRSAEQMTRRAGKAELLKFYRGERLTRNEAIKARCFECTGGEGARQCVAHTCPLAPYSPYHGNGGHDEAA